MKQLARVVFFALLVVSSRLFAQSGPFDARALEIFRELIEINTTDSVGSTTKAAEAMAAHLTANLIRLKQEGFKPDRDLVLALTADEEGGNFNGVEWLVKTHRHLIDAGLAINEGGSGQMKAGKYLINEVQASEKVYQDFRLEAKNPGGHSSRPPKDNAISHLANGLARLGRYDFRVNMNEITRAYFERMAGMQ